MLKLPKGLKKKKKGKKSKKDQELFTEEELEQYKREHQVQAEHQAEEHHQQTENTENDDEWSKFQALTTGVDSILKKTQGDLDRIKSSSFFQRVAPASQQKAPEPVVQPQEVAKEEPKVEEQDVAQQLLNAVVELSESEEDSDYDDGAFDTTYIDKELPLAYVPESPEDEEAVGPDPFDTGYADKLIKGPEVSSRGKKIVNIGAAVQVLTGKVDTAATASKSRRQRRGIQNLLLESFEANLEEGDAAGVPEPIVANTLLDEPTELGDDLPIDLSVSLHLPLLQKKREEEEADGGPKVDSDILDEFDVLKKDNEDDEFAQLAAGHSTHTGGVKFTGGRQLVTQESSADWAEFEASRGEARINFQHVHELIKIFLSRERKQTKAAATTFKATTPIEPSNPTRRRRIGGRRR